MSRAYRVLTTCLIVVGAGFLGLYFMIQNKDQKFLMLERPSYYIIQNYWYFFLAEIAVLFFSLLGSFFSWFRSMEEQEKVLPNAGYSNQEDITKWVGGTSLDTKRAEEMAEILKEDEHTVLLMKDESTELIEVDGQTKLPESGERTELLAAEGQRQGNYD